MDTEGSVQVAETVSSTGFPGWPSATAPGLPAVSKLFISNPANPDKPCLTAAIENAASFEPASRVPGELVTLRGVDIGPFAPAAAQPDADGFIGTQLAGTQVFFNGIPAPLLYTSLQQINAQVPWEVAGATTVQVQVSNAEGYSNAAAEQLQATSPALFYIPPVSASASPPFPGAILNQDGTLNSPWNPAARGSVVALFGTGGGTIDPPGITGAPWPANALGQLTLPVAVDIFRTPATVLYARRPSPACSKSTSKYP